MFRSTIVIQMINFLTIKLRIKSFRHIRYESNYRIS